MDEKLSPEERILVLEDAMRYTIATFTRTHSKLMSTAFLASQELAESIGTLSGSIDLLEIALGDYKRQPEAA